MNASWPVRPREDADSVIAQTAVVIPARNEQESLALVLQDLPNVACVVVANNGSHDNTAAIAADAGCVVVNEPIPGYGRACLAGMSRLTQWIDASGRSIRYVAFIDADYSDHPEQLVDLVSALRQEKADFVLGSRMRGDREPGAMPPQAVLGNRLACWLMKLIWGTSYSDLGPMRIIDHDKLMKLGMRDLNFGWTIEMQIKAHVAGLKTIEVPVSYRRRVGVSKISGAVSGTVRAGYKILYTIAKFALAGTPANDSLAVEMNHVRAHKPA